MFDPRPRPGAPTERRSTLLARAGTLLDSSLDYELTLASVARLAVPGLADWCSVDVLDETGTVRNVALAHVDTAKAGLARELRRRYPEDPQAPGAVHRVLRTGEPELHRDIPDAMLVEAARDSEELRLLRAVGMRSGMIVPLVARERTLGAMTFIAAESRRRFDEDDFALAEELAERCALALDNARLYREAHDAERRQAEALAVLDTVFARAPTGLALWDRDLRYLKVNDSLAAMNGLTRDAHIGRTVEEVLPEIGPGLAETLRGVLRTGKPVSDVEVTGETPAAPGSDRHWLASYYPVPDPRGGMLGVGAVVVDITARKRAEEEQRQRAAQQAAVVELGRSALAGTDPSALMEHAASLVAETLGVEYCEVSQLLPHGEAVILRAGTGWREGRIGTATIPAAGDSPAGLALRSGAPVIVEDLETESRFAGAALLHEHGVVSGITVVVPDSPSRPFGVLAAHTSSRREFSAGDTSFLEAVANLLASAIERRHAEEASHHLALHDHLTGLPGRTLFLDRVAQALARTDRRPGSPALLFFDLDRFKVVNDSLGHAAGDELLVAVTGRVRETVRREDTLSRFGGDEFTVLCEEVANERVATALAGRIAKALEAPFRIGDRDVFVGASIGIVFGRDASETPESLLRDADTAMYHAKERGRGRFEVFHERMRPQALERLMTESALRQAVEADGFRVVYQPVIDLRTRTVVGAEALVRWDHPKRGTLEPREFIPLAEETGLIVSIGAFVLEEACRQAGRWAAACPDAPPLKIFVNLSATQLCQPDLPELARRALADSGIDPGFLCLEITESVLMSDVHAALNSLLALKALGVRLAIDDFGTGYSSLSYLKRLPVDYLKVDSSFVEGLGRHPDDSTLIVAMTRMARALGLTVIAEGVETAEQLEELDALECELGQGYYLARPQSADALDGVLGAGRS